jgi:hypothetical protein
VIDRVPQTTDTALNQSLGWTSLAAGDRAAFLNQGEKVFLHSGFMLYKLTEYDIANRAGKITEWWSPVSPYRLEAGLESRKGLARRLGVPVPDLVRATYAVREDWNALTCLLTATLRKGVYGWYGQCSLQPRSTPGQAARPDVLSGTGSFRTANLPGYAWQFYIPNLTPAHIQKVMRAKF